MSTQFDDKGKYFTDVVPKEAIPVTIQTFTHRIHGVLYKRQKLRLIDELNRDNEDRFIALTDITVYNAQGSVLYQTDFIMVGRDQIVWIIPDIEVKTSSILGSDS